MADDPYTATRTLLEERPDIAPALEAVLAAANDDVDGVASNVEGTAAEAEGTAADGSWSFDDVDVDSGTFGELVSRGIVQRAAGDATGDYRVADREAVRAALDGEDYEGTTDDDTAGLGDRFRERLGGETEIVHRDLLIGLVGGFVLLFVMRTVTIRRVFREERVLLPGNDPYHYLYWTERLAESDVDPLDFEGIAAVLGGRAAGEPLVYTIGWWATELFGDGTADAIATVAWIPIVCALVVGAGVYFIALWTTNDERIGVLSVVVFAFLPAHALYSGVGFFDHHTIDYVWLTLSIGGVLWLARDHETRDPGTRRKHLTAPATWLVVAGLGVILAAMVHTWNGSPILLVGLAVYATIRATSDMRAGWNPLVSAGPLVGALGFGFLLAYALHARAGWQEPVAVYSLALVGLGVVLVASAATILQRLDVHPGVHLGVSAVSIVPVFLGFRQLRPEAAARLVDRATDSLLGREGIAETRSLFAADFGVFLGPIDHFGWFLFVALPVLGWVTWQCVRNHEPRWLVVVGYATALIGFALVQIRFAGEASGLVAVLAGVGVVYLLSVLDVAERPTLFGPRTERTRMTLRSPGISWQQAGYAAGTVLLIASLSVFMVPAVLDTVAAGDEEAEAIEWIVSDDQAATDGEDTAYVLTEWGRSRMFNYAVSGESDGYSYAQRNYEPFVSDADPDAHAEEFAGTVDYVVIHEIDGESSPESAYAQLFEAHGSATEAASGSGRFQFAYRTTNDGIAVFQLVDGATITGEAAPGETVTVRTEVEVSGESITYERRATAGDDGAFSVIVAHPGEYEVDRDGAATDGASVVVPDESVHTGGTEQV